MFADDTNLFLSNKDINKLFHVMNTELQKMSIWLKTNKLSLNLEEQRNCILCTILESSLFCLIQLYVGLHFLQFHLENSVLPLNEYIKICVTMLCDFGM